jgi:predicted  nucleic acid-binding Zn-ribbon protein
MDKNELRDSLDKFHKELEKIESLESSDRERLEGMETRLRGMLETDATGHDAWTIETLEQAIRQFEVTHPELTITIGHLLNILSQEGI